MKIALILGMVAVLSMSGDGLKCYICDNCKEPFTKNATLLKDCGPGNDHCAKGVITHKNKTKVYIRECVNATLMKNPSRRSQLNSSLYDPPTYYFCGGDECNEAGSISSVIPIIFTTLVVSFFVNF